MILNTIITALTLNASPAPTIDQVALIPGKKIPISATSPSRVSGKKIRINGSMEGLDILRIGKKIRIDASNPTPNNIFFGKKIRINESVSDVEVAFFGKKIRI
jgi:hypothetical protein